MSFGEGWLGEFLECRNERFKLLEAMCGVHSPYNTSQALEGKIHECKFWTAYGEVHDLVMADLASREVDVGAEVQRIGAWAPLELRDENRRVIGFE